MSKFMRGLRRNYSFKFMPLPCVQLGFLIFVSRELMSAKY